MNTLFIFKRDLRLFGNPALFHALSKDPSCHLVYIHDEKESDLGGASKWWLHQSLLNLCKDIEKLGGKLNIFKGDTHRVIHEMCNAHQITHVCWSISYNPTSMEKEDTLKQSLSERGIEVYAANSSLLFEPFSVKSLSTQKPFQVFTPFWKRCVDMGLERFVCPKASHLAFHEMSDLSVEDLTLLPSIPWTKGLEEAWIPGEKGAHKRLDHFLIHSLKNYQTNRDIPGIEGTSRLSPHLHFGEISVEYVVHRVLDFLARDPSLKEGAETFLKELGWREFAHHLLFYVDDFENTPLRKEFLNFPWKHNVHHLTAWKKGLTGYPIIDAGMRELWQTGWMHNRVRMITASFLVKDLLIHWKEGATWFMDTLVDADIANNTSGWQWVSGCGADASPYFRIFNPVLQSEKFDKDGDYIRCFVPELAHLPSKYIHAPWKAPRTILAHAGVSLMETIPQREMFQTQEKQGKFHEYPLPIVNHDVMRKEALECYASIKKLTV